MWSCSNCGKTNPDDASECVCGFRHQVRADSIDDIGENDDVVLTELWKCPLC
ncbi:MAG: hypothetical protein LIO74_09140 [Ruminococcus sp.]|nr:hypothetical protein [Ruminococcus sp.]